MKRFLVILGVFIMILSSTVTVYATRYITVDQPLDITQECFLNSLNNIESFAQLFPDIDYVHPTSGNSADFQAHASYGFITRHVTGTITYNVLQDGGFSFQIISGDLQDTKMVITTEKIWGWGPHQDDPEGGTKVHVQLYLEYSGFWTKMGLSQTSDDFISGQIKADLLKTADYIDSTCPYTKPSATSTTPLPESSNQNANPSQSLSQSMSSSSANLAVPRSSLPTSSNTNEPRYTTGSPSQSQSGQSVPNPTNNGQESGNAPMQATTENPPKPEVNTPSSGATMPVQSSQDLFTMMWVDFVSFFTNLFASNNSPSNITQNQTTTQYTNTTHQLISPPTLSNQTVQIQSPQINQTVKGQHNVLPIMQPYKPLLAINTDKSAYRNGDQVIISGSINENRYVGGYISIMVLRPDGTILDKSYVQPVDGEFSEILDITEPQWDESGTYKIRVQYGLENLAQTSFVFYR